jgi:dTMP kinase
LPGRGAQLPQQLAEQRQGSDRSYLGGASDIHESSIDFQKTVRSLYLAEAERDPHFRRIDCTGPGGTMLPPEEIFDRIREEVGL